MGEDDRTAGTGEDDREEDKLGEGRVEAGNCHEEDNSGGGDR